MTEKGRSRYALVAQAFSEMEAQAFRDIPAAEREQFLATFEKIYANLTERGAGSDC